MLNHFDAALSCGSRVQSLDPLAVLAEGFLDVLAVLIMQSGRTTVVIGSSDGASAIDALTLARALASCETDVTGLHADAMTVHGTPIDAPPPFTSVVKFPIRSDGTDHSCILFPRAAGVALGKLRQFDRAARRHIAEHRLLERYRGDLKRYVELFDTIQSTAKIGVWDEGGPGEPLYWSEGVHRIHDTAPSAPPPHDHLDHFPEPGRGELVVALERTRCSGVPTDLTLPLLSARGRRRTVRIIASAQPRLTGPVRLAGTLQDVTALTQATQKLWWNANHDALTKLPNRALFGDRFRKALERHARHHNIVALLVVDVDRLKHVNESLGQAAGDELLIRVAQALNGAVRAKDTVARTGGDEFSILMDDIDGVEGLNAVLDRIARSLQIRLEWGKAVLEVALSAGAAAAPLHGTRESDLIAAADSALRRMKETPGPALALCEVGGRPVAARGERLVARARSALDAGAIRPFYQPQIDIRSGQVVAVEALARWQIRADQNLTAAEFADAVRDKEVGPQISRRVAEHAISEVAAFNRMRARKITLSVNATSPAILAGGLFEAIAAARDAAGTEQVPVLVEVAQALVTEQAAAHGMLADQMRAAGARGIGISLVDCDLRGNLTLASRHLPVKELKIQGRHVEALADDRGCRDAATDLMALTRSLNIRVVFEGIESRAQARLIAALGGEIGQGYYFSAALPLDELAELLDGGWLAVDRSTDEPVHAPHAA